MFNLFWKIVLKKPQKGPRKQNVINQNLQKFTCKHEATISTLCMRIRVYDVTYVETQFDYSKYCNFINLWELVKTTIKWCERFYSIKLTKISKAKQRWNVLYIRGYDVTHAGLKLCNFTTSWELIKTPQTAVQSSFL